ncbi:Sporulation kinase E [Pelotomaculum schinkii]|uniref:histidine kinase n=1 Tax=Pelotomaculum schinkii TaxID=78350 RepID=A0A4Y7RB88_9FIRM|nr:PocR ligand-binding domain-containing protein [Pelotomaculum schinkii]TEB06092.1 Sporulation kinase E [Pelotomaculum schinkii]
MDYRFSDLIDMHHLHKLMSSFYEATGILSAIVDIDGNILSAEGWQDICTKFHRICPQSEYKCKQSDSFISDHLHEGPFIGYRCLNGLMDYSTPIIVEGRHMATLFTGQLLHEHPDEEFFRRQAKEYGFDETAYIEALRRVPIISKERVEFVMIFYSQLAQLLGVIGLERKHQLEAADKVLKEREERLRLVLEESNDGFWDYNVETGEVYYSPGWIKMLGYSPEEIEPHRRTWEELLHPDDKPNVMKVLNEHLERQTTRYEVEQRLLASSGEWKWILARGEVVARDKHGRPLRMVGTHTDITERKQSEAALRESEERYCLLFNNSIDAVLLADPDGVIYATNPEACRIFRRTEDELCQAGIDAIIDTADPRHTAALQERIRTGKFRGELTFIRKDGSKFTGELSSAVFKDKDGLDKSSMIIRDITERKQFEKEMARLDRMELVGKMAAGIGHEIRNPMTTVRGFLQILARKQDCSHYQDFYNLMISELDRANSIITEFLSLAKNKKVELKPQNLNRIVDALFPLISADSMLADKYIEIELGDIPDLAIDEKEIRQLILNLVRNGIEAMSPGGKLTIKTLQDGDQVVLSIQDQGNGIKPDVLEKLGTPFFSTKDSGTGLGLAVCYSIANRHNAYMKVETGPGGTTFSVRFTQDRLEHLDNN